MARDGKRQEDGKRQMARQMAHSEQVDSKMAFAQTVCEDVGEGNPRVHPALKLGFTKSTWLPHGAVQGEEGVPFRRLPRGQSQA